MGTIFCVLIAAAGILMVFLPLPKKVGATEEKYVCAWDDGAVTEENYFSAIGDLVGVTEDGCLELKRGTHVGKIATQNTFLHYNAALSGGSLLELLQLGKGDFSRIERAALFREYGGDIYYSVDAFHYTGAGVVRTSAKRAEKVVLLSGTLPAGYLAQTGATQLRLAAEAEFSADRLLGSRIETFEAVEPYLVEESALFLTVAGQTRLLAAPPAAETLTLPEYDYADEGALLSCTSLRSLTLPFAGNAKRNAGTDYDGTFAWLFSGEDGFAVPKSLKRVKILGGELIGHCFYDCPNLEEVDVCGLDPNNISRDALSDMVGWKLVHAPRNDLILTGKYTSHAAPCGCTVFERIEEIL